MIRQFYYVREKYLDRFEKIINKEMGVADFEIGNFRINENLFYTLKEAIEVRNAIIDYVSTNYSKEVLKKLRYSIVPVEIDENVIDSNRKWRTGSFVKMGFYKNVIVDKKGVQVDLSQFHDFDGITIENISMVFDKKGKCV